VKGVQKCIILSLEAGYRRLKKKIFGTARTGYVSWDFLSGMKTMIYAARQAYGIKLRKYIPVKLNPIWIIYPGHLKYPLRQRAAGI